MPIDNHEQLLRNIKENMQQLEDLLSRAGSHWEYEDPVYRLYHQSFKVYRIQDLTREIIGALMKLAPEGTKMNDDFKKIYDEGASGKVFEMKHNQNWLFHTRPMLEAFFHAKFFLEMAIKYGKGLDHAPEMLPSGWAALLYLYNLR